VTASPAAFGLSPLQQGMLFDHLLYANAGIDIQQRILTLPERIDENALAGAWATVIARTEILRASFRWSDADAPSHVIAPHVDVPLPVEDLRSLEAPDRARRIDEYLRDDRRLGFDLDRPPLMRLKLFRVADACFKLVWTAHHILLDGRSFVNVLSEVFALYDGADEHDRANAVPQYREFIAWLEQQDFEAAEPFWRRRLRGFTFATPLPAQSSTRSLPAEAGRHRERTIHFDGAKTAELERLASQHGFGITTTLQVAWAIVLARYSGQDDVVFGAVRAGRRSWRDDSSASIGLFINTLPMRIQVAADAPVGQVLAAASNDWRELRAYEHTPLSSVRRWSGIEGTAPLFESIVVYERRSVEQALQAVGGAWQSRRHELYEQTAAPLSLAVLGSTELALTLQYDPQRFDDGSAHLVLAQFAAVLASLATADLTRCVRDIGWDTFAPVREVVAEPVVSQASIVPDVTLGELAQAQAARNPAATALEWQLPDGTFAQLTHGDVHACADALAAALRARGLRPASAVGIAVQRSPALLVAVLAVIKAGCHYVPLDPEYPRDRLDFMIEDSGVGMLLTDSASASHVSRGTLDVVLVDDYLVCVNARNGSTERMSTVAQPDAPAYMMYTSGSTGRPKGVPISHRAIVNQLLCVRDRYAIETNDVLLQNTPFNFDPSVSELWLPLLTGARLVFLRPGGHRDAEYFVETILARGVTIIDIVPSVLRALVAQSRFGDCASLRTIVCGGETLDPQLAADYYAVGLHADLHNHYGPTEAAIQVSYWRCLRTWPRHAAIPIGFPVANTHFYVLDEHAQLVAPGDPGELYVGGVQVGLGYWNRPELTAERFVPDRFGTRADAKLYRTGDIVSLRPDGALEFRGRADDQVKIRGFRVELGEIEATLAVHPLVEKAAVVLRSAEGLEELVAYVVLQPASVDDARRDHIPATLQAHLRSRLPDHMIPAYVVTLDAFPLAPSGKIDRNALPAPTADARAYRANSMAPQTPSELQVAEVFAHVLKIPVDRIGVDDDFFALGGHSMLAMRVLTRLNQTLRAGITLRDIFDVPTVRGLAAKAVPSRGAATTPIGPRSDSTARLSYGQETLWLFERATPGLAVYNVPDVRRLRGRLDAAALQRALDGVIARHAILRSTIDSSAREPVPVTHADAHPTIGIEDLAACAPAEREDAAFARLREEIQTPFDLEVDLPIRVRLVRIAADDHLLLVLTHHIVSDGVSCELVFVELMRRYEADIEGRVAEFAQPAIDYRDFASWERRELSDSRRAELTSFWRATLCDRPAALALPFDRPRPLNPGYAGSSVSMRVDPSTVRELRALAQQHDATLYLVLLTAFVALLSRYTAQTDIVVGSPFSGRTRRELEDVVGYFVNTLPVRTRFAPEASFSEMLALVRTSFLDVLAHQELPYELVAAEVANGGGGGSLMQAVFDLQRKATAMNFGGVDAMAIKVDLAFAKFDLTCTAVDSADDIELVFEFRRDLFERETIQRLANHFALLLQSIVAESRAPIAALPLMSAPERTAVVKRFNDTGMPFTGPTTLLGLAEAQRDRTPSNVALEWRQPNGQLVRRTHADVHALAASFARRLRDLGVGPGVAVGVYAQRSPAIVVAVLAVLKAGGYYVPLDTDFPQERLSFMLADAEPRVLLVDETPCFDVPDRIAVVRLDDIVSQADVEPEESAGGRVTVEPSHSAYMIYTSGSTGHPKGVAISNRSIVNQLLWKKGHYEIDSDDVFSMNSSFGFDISISEMWLPLVSGARLVVLEPGGHREPSYFIETIVTHGITLIEIVPSLLRTLVATPGFEHCRSLRLILAGGEKLTPELAREYFHHGLPADLYNQYGPTETTIMVSLWRCDRESLSNAPIPIGRPVANTQLYILDGRGEAVPIGVPGELHVGGVQVAAGYWNRPQETLAKFTSDPFTDDPGARLYKTGDLARFRSDGAIEYLGRTDDQIKVRGFRIEPGEIEATLRQHACVGEAAVIVGSGPALDEQLVAYFTAAGAIEPYELRAHLRATLPEYMVPSFYVRLKAMPLLPNGKLDRNALPMPDDAARSRRAAYTAPENETQRIVAHIVADILNLPRERLSIDDDFFEIGGTSLLAMRVVTRVAATLRTRITMSSFFAGPTVRMLAATTIQSAPEGRIELVAAAVGRLASMSPEERERRQKLEPVR